MRIALDVMGADKPPQELILAARKALELFFGPDDELVIIAHPDFIPTTSERRLSFVSALEWIDMEDAPLLAVRHKKRSSIQKGLELLKEREVEALVSCGNTGALVAASRFHLGLLPGIEITPLLVDVPTQKKELALLDIGASLSASSHQLVQFARMGVAYKASLHQEGKASFSVGLLNIGKEEHKGSSEQISAFQLLQEDKRFSFVGNVESDALFTQPADVVVTDGKTGNVLLKALEGFYLALTDSLPVDMQKKVSHFDYRLHAGALLVGVDGIVVKCHGRAEEIEVVHSLKKALYLARGNFVSSLQSFL